MMAAGCAHDAVMIQRYSECSLSLGRHVAYSSVSEGKRQAKMSSQPDTSGCTVTTVAVWLDVIIKKITQKKITRETY